MKSLIIIIYGCVLAAFATRLDCIVKNECAPICEEGTHGYSSGCGPVTPEATCVNPEPKVDSRGAVCDYMSCYCNPPTVRDMETKKCVALEDCPKSQTKKDNCIYILGTFAGCCEEGTHPYTTGVICGPVMPEATCANPKPKMDTEELVCEYGACYCDSPTVRDLTTNNCVALEDCSKSQPNETTFEN